MAEQAARLEYVHTGFFTSEAAEELAVMVADMSPGTLDRVWYTSSGSEAIEAALKLARQYHLERGDADSTFKPPPLRRPVCRVEGTLTYRQSGR